MHGQRFSLWVLFAILAFGIPIFVARDDLISLVYNSQPSMIVTPEWTAESEQVTARLGVSVATAGDVNGDGYADVIVGANQYDNGQTNEGRVFVYYGSEEGLSPTPAWTAESDQAKTYFGWSLGTAGDVNGDGYDDVIVGAYEYDNGQLNEGRAFVYYGSIDGLSSTPDWTAEGNQPTARFGFTVGTAGDVNGDGYDDVIVGAEYYDDDIAEEGQAFVYYGGAEGLSVNPNWAMGSDQPFSRFGASVGTARDVNGDGYDDVIVGAWGFDSGQSNEGKVFVYHGASGGPSMTPDWTAELDQEFAAFGWSVGTAGDVNGDGYAEVMVGTYGYDGNGGGDEGRADVYYGSAVGLSGVANWTATGGQAFAELGGSVATAGDVDGDGYDDVMIGANRYDHGQANEGQVSVYYGSGGGLSLTPAWTAEADQAHAHFGWSVGTAGDVNGDGTSDVIIGAPDFDNGQKDEGRAFVFQGSSNPLPPTATPTASTVTPAAPTPTPTAVVTGRPTLVVTKTPVPTRTPTP